MHKTLMFKAGIAHITPKCEQCPLVLWTQQFYEDFIGFCLLSGAFVCFEKKLSLPSWFTKANRKKICWGLILHILLKLESAFLEWIYNIEDVRLLIDLICS